MFATVRQYAGLSEDTVASLAAMTDELGTVLASVPGSLGIHVIRSREGIVLVTVADDEPCLVEAGRRFRAWVDAHVLGFPAAVEPQQWSGPVLYRDAWIAASE